MRDNDYLYISHKLDTLHSDIEALIVDWELGKGSRRAIRVKVKSFIYDIKKDIKDYEMEFGSFPSLYSYKERLEIFKERLLLEYSMISAKRIANNIIIKKNTCI